MHPAWRIIALASILLQGSVGLAQQAPADSPSAATQPVAGAADLFAPPVALVDQDGKVIITRRSIGHPLPYDLDGDGKCDIVLGCHQNMDTDRAEILLLKNVGTSGQPRFTWPAKPLTLAGAATTKPAEPKAADDQSGQAKFAASCGCKSSGAFETHVADYNGDGLADLVVDTYWTQGVLVLLNVATDKGQPTFRKDRVLHGISSHGKGSGGGDWDNDGVMDLVFPVNSGEWEVYPGRQGGPAPQTRYISPGIPLAMRFADKPTLSSKDFRIVGQKQWFEHSPYAWNFSGQHGRGSPVTEIVAVRDDPGNEKRPFTEHLCHINYYWLDRQAKTCTAKGTLATSKAAYTRLGIGDVNGDGRMDILYTGGVFTKGDETKLWVLYGKLKNMPV